MLAVNCNDRNKVCNHIKNFPTETLKARLIGFNFIL